jgi:hypothetical protein
MKNCFGCKFKRTLSTGLLSSSECKTFKREDYVLLKEAEQGSTIGETVGKCDAGFNDRFESFWHEHNRKTHDQLREEKIELNCHDYEDGTKILISMNEKTTELIEKLKKIEKF